MLSWFAQDADHIYLALGATDFRKQTDSLVSMINLQFKMNPFSDNCVFLFCDRKRNAIKVLRYDRTGFVLANKKPLQDMKFQWPKKEEDVKEITMTQVKWLLQGLSIEQKKHIKI